MASQSKINYLWKMPHGYECDFARRSFGRTDFDEREVVASTENGMLFYAALFDSITRAGILGDKSIYELYYCRYNGRFILPALIEGIGFGYLQLGNSDPETRPAEGMSFDASKGCNYMDVIGDIWESDGKKRGKKVAPILRMMRNGYESLYERVKCLTLDEYRFLRDVQACLLMWREAFLKNDIRVNINVPLSHSVPKSDNDLCFEIARDLRELGIELGVDDTVKRYFAGESIASIVPATGKRVEYAPFSFPNWLSETPESEYADCYREPRRSRTREYIGTMVDGSQVFVDSEDGALRRFKPTGKVERISYREFDLNLKCGMAAVSVSYDIYRNRETACCYRREGEDYVYDASLDPAGPEEGLQPLVLVEYYRDFSCDKALKNDGVKAPFVTYRSDARLPGWIPVYAVDGEVGVFTVNREDGSFVFQAIAMEQLQEEIAGKQADPIDPARLSRFRAKRD